MAGTSAGARLGWLTRRGQRLPRDPQQRARIAAIEEHAAGTFAGPLRSGPAARARAPQSLTPVARVDPRRLDPYAPPDPHALREMYGDRQLPNALERYSPEQLSRAAERVGVRPGRSKRETIARIVGAVTGRPAPTAPARREARSDAGYEEWKRQFEAALAANNGVAASNLGASHSGYMARWRREHPEHYQQAPRAKSSTPVRGQRVRVENAASVERLRRDIKEQEDRLDELSRRLHSEYDLNGKAFYTAQVNNARKKLAKSKAKLSKAEGRKPTPDELYLTSSERARGIRTGL